MESNTSYEENSKNGNQPLFKCGLTQEENKEPSLDSVVRQHAEHALMQQVHLPIQRNLSKVDCGKGEETRPAEHSKVAK